MVTTKPLIFIQKKTAFQIEEYFFLFTENFERDYQDLLFQGITIVRTSAVEKWRTVVF